MDYNSKILITGARGLIGSALVRHFRSRGFDHLITPSLADVNWADPVAAKWHFSVYEPEYVFHCAARVGGLQDNIDHPVDFLMENLAIQTNVISNAAEYKVKKLLFLGSSCIYPTTCPRPMREEHLLTGPFEGAVEAYGLAKTVGIKMCQYYRRERGCNFISALPCNIFGVNDRLDERTSHVVPGMLLRMHRAKQANAPMFGVWGDGTAKRELLFADDLAEALHVIMDQYSHDEPINAGSGNEVSIRELAESCAAVVGYKGLITYNSAAPVGTRHKRLDNWKLETLAWRSRTPLSDALYLTYQDIQVRA